MYLRLKKITLHTGFISDSNMSKKSKNHSCRNLINVSLVEGQEGK